MPGTTTGYPGFSEVTMDAFYAAIGPTPGYATIINDFEHGGRGYVSEHYEGEGWRSPILGCRESGDFPSTPARFFLREETR